MEALSFVGDKVVDAAVDPYKDDRQVDARRWPISSFLENPRQVSQSREGGPGSSYSMVQGYCPLPAKLYEQLGGEVESSKTGVSVVNRQHGRNLGTSKAGQHPAVDFFFIPRRVTLVLPSGWHRISRYIGHGYGLVVTVASPNFEFVVRLCHLENGVGLSCSDKVKAFTKEDEKLRAVIGIVGGYAGLNSEPYAKHIHMEVFRVTEATSRSKDAIRKYHDSYLKVGAYHFVNKLVPEEMRQKGILQAGPFELVHPYRIIRPFK